MNTMSEIILDQLHLRGADRIFAIPGAQIDFFLKCAVKDSRFQVILAADELGAGHMADGYSRVSGKLGVVLTINGPGATNLITSIVSTRSDHSRVLYITGDGPVLFRGLGGFQTSDCEDSNTESILSEAAGRSITIAHMESLKTALKMLDECRSLKLPYPIHINLPCDIAMTTFPVQNHITSKSEIGLIDLIEEGSDAGSFLSSRQSRLNCIHADPGIRSAVLLGEKLRDKKDVLAILDFCVDYNFPIAITASALDLISVIPATHFLGIFGYAGNIHVNSAFLNPDLEMLIIFGSDLDERTTCIWHEQFFHDNRQIIRVSEKAARWAHEYKNLVDLHDMDIDGILTWLRSHWQLTDQEKIKRQEWFNLQITNASQIEPKVDHLQGSGFTLRRAVRHMSEKAPENCCFFLDSGEHRIIASQSWIPRRWNSFFTSGKFAAMGWAISAGIGASFSEEHPVIWILTGDGCMLMQAMNLAIAAKFKRNIVIFMSNNRTYGRIASRLAHDDEAVRNNLSQLPMIDWAMFAESLGLKSFSVSNQNELDQAINQSFDLFQPVLIDLKVTDDPQISALCAIFSSTSENVIRHWSTKHYAKPSDCEG